MKNFFCFGIASVMACSSVVTARESGISFPSAIEEADLASSGYLKQFEGTFETIMGPFELKVIDSKLMALVPEYPSFPLNPSKPYCFTVDGVEGLTIRFVKDSSDQVSEMIVTYADTDYTLRKVV